MVKETRSIRRQILPNGLTVITEHMPHIRSVAIGIWLKSGSRDEDSEWNGISHFIEHMVFKGTETRSAEAIARQVDSIGGNMDAFTAKEGICFNIKVLDEHLPLAIDAWAAPRPELVSRINLRNKKSLGQVQICIGVASHPLVHDRLYACYSLN